MLTPPYFRRIYVNFQGGAVAQVTAGYGHRVCYLKKKTKEEKEY